LIDFDNFGIIETGMNGMNILPSLVWNVLSC